MFWDNNGSFNCFSYYHNIFKFIFHFEHTFLIAILFILTMSSLVVSLILFLRELFYTTKFINNKESYIP
ncbi:DUF2721 domain-containing protein [Aliarcobacter skirrowii]|uniref:DUF2721 domain-containing protein n=1 Tax=Aliarcobacter skirrowii TaxID=28200 RepID=UPI00385120E3